MGLECGESVCCDDKEEGEKEEEKRDDLYVDNNEILDVLDFHFLS